MFPSPIRKRFSNTAAFSILLVLFILIGRSAIGETLVATIASVDLNRLAFETVDVTARSIQVLPGEGVKSLASRVTKTATTDVEKARALYVWLTENIRYDAEGYFSGSYGSVSVEEVLKTGKSVCQGYANLFESMSRAVGLDAVTITGWAKGAAYALDTFARSAANHAWNAVKIGERWFLVDCAWGAGHLSGREFVKSFDPFYFMTPPEQLICSHFPKNADWQLLDPPVTKEAFLKIPKTWSNFFRCGIEVLTSVYERMPVDVEEVFRFRVPESSGVLFSLYGPDWKPLPLQLFSQREGEIYEVRARFAETGDYELHVFARRNSDVDPLYHSAVALSLANPHPSVPIEEYPETYPRYQETQSFLFYPFERILPADESISFKIRIPEAEEAAVLSGDEWSFLFPEGGAYAGNVWIQEGSVIILARFPGEATFQYLVEYVARKEP